LEAGKTSCLANKLPKLHTVSQVSVLEVRSHPKDCAAERYRDQAGRDAIRRFMSLYAYLGGVGSLHDISRDVIIRRYKSPYIVISRYKSIYVAISRHISLYVVISRCKLLYVAGSRYIP